MSSKNTERNVTDILLWVAAVGLLSIAVILNSMYANQPAPLRIIAWIFVAAMVAGMLFPTSQGRRFRGFAKDSRTELRKVVWPSRQETVQSSGMVVVMVLLVSLILWGLDSLFFWLVGLVTQLV